MPDTLSNVQFMHCLLLSDMRTIFSVAFDCGLTKCTFFCFILFRNGMVTKMKHNQIHGIWCVDVQSVKQHLITVVLCCRNFHVFCVLPLKA